MISTKKKPGDAGLTVKVVTYTLLFVVVFASLFPFYMMFVSSTLSNKEILTERPRLIFGSNLANNYKNFNERFNVAKVLFNSIFITITYTILSLLLHSMAGYALAKFEFKGKNLIFSIILITLMIPLQVLLIPLFKMMNSIGWQNSYQAVIIPALANAFGIFLMRQNMISFPDSLIEAARIDGSGEFAIFFKIVLPTMRPAIGALGIYNFMAQWGNFMWPLIILSTKDKYTLPVALSALEGLQRRDFGVIMFGSTIATIPIMIIFLIFQRQFISGMLGGSVKG
ncbi:MAG: carbohydrate ABC transporter permease [Maledivibacter sp.]|jgi:lactose/L-arabinose transport system permease protein|nr:carbohydrate ABC transporter permease [Maledivibacter sp.]